jgi:hypothetical protein
MSRGTPDGRGPVPAFFQSAHSQNQSGFGDGPGSRVWFTLASNPDE